MWSIVVPIPKFKNGSKKQSWTYPWTCWKNREISDLKDQNKIISEQLAACVEKLDSLIAENSVMKSRLSALETGPVLTPAHPILVATPPPPTVRQYYNVLILSDSIYRHIGGEMP